LIPKVEKNQCGREPGEDQRRGHDASIAGSTHPGIAFLSGTSIFTVITANEEATQS
jgi:hypothetical protein